MTVILSLTLGRKGNRDIEEDKGVIRSCVGEEQLGYMGYMRSCWNFGKAAGRVGAGWLLELFIVAFKTAKMSEEWRWSTMIPLYKNKDDT
uniref:Uncharacterized protein n=1 Tax=Solanum tuberosum TaxID=4113 RepID=M1C278_SOLTU